MSRIAVLGLGNFGTALTRQWTLAGHEVSGWTVEPEVHDSIASTTINTKYLPDIKLEGLTVSMNLEEVVVNADHIVLALPSDIVLDLVDQLIPHLRDHQNLLDLAKGLAPDDQLISEVIEQKLLAAGRKTPLCLMMGPTIAAEVARGVYTTALMASHDPQVATHLAAELSTRTLRLSPASDPVGAEYWGAFKNVIALACGLSDGLQERGLGGDNLKAAIFTAGFREAVRLLPALGAAPETANTAAGIGDLYVTAASPYGRNRQMGERLGRGQSLAEAQAEMVMVSEGVRAARMFRRRFTSLGEASKFVDAVCDLLDGKLSVEQFLDTALRPQ